jgi:hypothetical protein
MFMSKLTGILFLAACLVLGSAGCRRRPAEFAPISDASKEQFLTLTRLGHQAAPAAARLRVTGRIDRPATLILLRDGKPYVTRELPAGMVDTSWHGDWSVNQLMLHYLPGAGNGGVLQISYEFSD